MAFLLLHNYMDFIRKYIGIISFIVLVIIFVMGYFSDYGNNELILEGSYQSEGVGRPIIFFS